MAGAVFILAGIGTVALIFLFLIWFSERQARSRKRSSQR
jgi:hypothetical protein